MVEEEDEDLVVMANSPAGLTSVSMLMTDTWGATGWCWWLGPPFIRPVAVLNSWLLDFFRRKCIHTPKPMSAAVMSDAATMTPANSTVSVTMKIGVTINKSNQNKILNVFKRESRRIYTQKLQNEITRDSLGLSPTIKHVGVSWLLMTRNRKLLKLSFACGLRRSWRIECCVSISTDKRQIVSYSILFYSADKRLKVGQHLSLSLSRLLLCCAYV